MIRETICRWLGIRGEAPPAFEHTYAQTEGVNITAQIAQRLAMLTCGDSTLRCGDAVTEEAVGGLWRREGARLTARAFGSGGVVLMPLIRGGRVDIGTADQSRLRIVRASCGRIEEAELPADRVRQNGTWYTLLLRCLLEEGGVRIACAAVSDDGARVPVSHVGAWRGISAEVFLPGLAQMPFALLTCPADPRGGDGFHGVPVTYGAGPEIAELVEHIAVYRREYRLTRPMLGLDSTLWRDAGDIGAIRKTVQDSDDPFIPFSAPSLDGSGTWQYFAPDIRSDAMETRYQNLCRRVEKACGLSQGILTERQSVNYANRDEVRAAMYDTFCLVRAMRTAWEEAAAVLCSAVAALALQAGIPVQEGAAPEFDWDMSLLESTSETFSQMTALFDRGCLGAEELRAWVLPKPKKEG